MSLNNLLKNISKAKSQVSQLSSEEKSAFLEKLADAILAKEDFIKKENIKDLDRMDPKDSKYDRLLLTSERIAGLANSLRNVANLADPANQVQISKTLPNGLKLRKMAVPLGCVGVIYESRPNVTIDVASLCLRSGNICILKGGKEADFSNIALVSIIHEVLEQNGIHRDAVILLPADRSYTEALLQAKDKVDVIIPRGSDALIQYVRRTSDIPTIETGAGVCHTYVESTANAQMAADILVNAKVTRPSVCNSLDTAILDQSIAAEVIAKAAEGLKASKVEVYADEICFKAFEKVAYPFLKKANKDDFGKEWLDFKASFKAVNNIDEALEHIAEHSSKHSEAIVTENSELAQRFLMEVDAAAVYHNASTRFTDGEQFGLGAEIGISTQKLHARGPFALEKLVTEKWVIEGNGQIR
jgi:glutamate-5-semialdehyde dehydrogenase